MTRAKSEPRCAADRTMNPHVLLKLLSPEGGPHLNDVVYGNSERRNHASHEGSHSNSSSDAVETRTTMSADLSLDPAVRRGGIG